MICKRVNFECKMFSRSFVNVRYTLTIRDCVSLIIATDTDRVEFSIMRTAIPFALLFNDAH